MSEIEKSMKWLIQWACVLFVVALVVGLTPYARDDTDPGEWGNRSGISPRTDSLTGCQYLSTSGGGLTPRVDGRGRHLGCKA